MNAHEGGKPKAQVLMLYKEAATLYLNYLETSKHFQRIAPEEQRDVQSKVESILQIVNPLEKRLTAEEYLQYAEGRSPPPKGSRVVDLALADPLQQTIDPVQSANRGTIEMRIQFYKKAAALYMEILEREAKVEDSEVRHDIACCQQCLFIEFMTVLGACCESCRDSQQSEALGEARWKRRANLFFFA
ncbi:MAG: hypothetical protein AAFX78_20025 [Cyanobacteria bacterium J06638_20]